MRTTGVNRGGLCEDCVFSRVIENAKGSRFYLCRLSETDSRFAKYPPLPVLSCAGYRRTGDSVATSGDDQASSH